MIDAGRDAKMLGTTLNVLAAQGKVRAVQIVISDGRVLRASSCWAATDWLKDEGFYTADAHLTHPKYHIEYVGLGG